MSIMLFAKGRESSSVLGIVGLLLDGEVKNPMFICLGHGNPILTKLLDVLAGLNGMETVIIGAPAPTEDPELEVAIAREAIRRRIRLCFLFRTEEEVRNPVLRGVIGLCEFAFVLDEQTRKAAADLCSIAEVMTVGNNAESAGEIMIRALRIPVSA